MAAPWGLKLNVLFSPETLAPQEISFPLLKNSDAFPIPPLVEFPLFWKFISYTMLPDTLDNVPKTLPVPEPEVNAVPTTVDLKPSSVSSIPSLSSSKSLISATPSKSESNKMVKLTVPFSADNVQLVGSEISQSWYWKE